MKSRYWLPAYVGVGLLLIGLVVWVDRSGWVPLSDGAVQHANRSSSYFHK